MRTLKSTLLVIALSFAMVWQSFGQQYYEGIPVFVPATITELANQPWVTMSYTDVGSSPSYTPITPYTVGHTAATHNIILTSSTDSRACYTGQPTLTLKTMPDSDLVPDWDTDSLGPLRVLKLADHISGDNKVVSRIIYRFKPTEDENVLVVYFSFVAESPGHTYEINPSFRIEVLDQADNLLLLEPTDVQRKNSYFLVNPAGTNGANPAANIVSYNDCNGTVFWCNWIPVAFDLREYVGQNVKLQITSVNCKYDYHYAYGYYAARGFKGHVEAMACGDDPVVLTVPRGFKTYEWSSNLSPRISGNTYQITRNRNIAETNFSCKVTSETGATMTFTGVVDYYELEPDFEVESADTNCKYRRRFNANTSTVSIIRPTGTEAQEITYVKWNFGDGSEEIEGVDVLHAYDAPGIYTVTMTLFDNEEKCSAVITKEVDVTTLDTCKKDTTEFLCSEDFPNYYHPVYDKTFPAPGDYYFEVDEYCASGCPTIMHLTLVDNLPHGEGYDTVYVCKESFPYTHSSGNVFNMPGTYSVLYEDGSENGCDSTLYLRVVEVAPKVSIAIDGVFCDEFTAELYTVSESEVASYLWSTGEFTDRITITEPGQYNVTITDEQNCKAENLFKVPACIPNIILANAISPSDQNGINDYFHLPQVSLIESAEVTIYDRFGTLVFYSKDKNFKWDGTVNGKLATHATYNYILLVTDYNGITTRHSGNLGVY